MRLKNYSTILICFFLVTTGCNGGASGGNDNDSSPTPTQTSSLGTLTQLNFTFRNQIDHPSDPALDSNVTFPDSLSLPVYVKSDGHVTIVARHFPAVVLRICKTGSTNSDCDMTISSASLTSDVDLVLDACGASVADASCGNGDSTVFSGSLTENGFLAITNLAIRVRLFAVTASSDGYSADAQDTGLIPGLPRIIANPTTELSEAGFFSATGARLSDEGIRLVSAGIIPSGMPVLGNSPYLATLTGQFDVDPLTLLE